MENFKNWLTSLMAIVILGLSLTVAHPAQAITYHYTWTGNSGYSAQGTFSYDETQGYSVITQNELESLSIAFFDPFNNLMKKYNNIENGKSTDINDYLKLNFKPLKKSFENIFDVGEGNLIGEQDFYLKGKIGSQLELRNLDTNVLDRNGGKITLEKVEEDATKNMRSQR